MGELFLSVGRDLSYEDEKIIRKKAADFQIEEVRGLCTALVENENPAKRRGPHIRDDAFVVYLAVNYFKLWERWRAYWVVHIIMAVFFFVYGRFWLLSAGKMPTDKERRNRKVTGILCFGICFCCLLLGVYTF